MVAHQKLTYDWWENRRPSFELYTLQLVIREASRGDRQAVEKRLEALQNIPLLESNPAALELAEIFLYQQHVIPEKAREDAFHIAMAITQNMDYLLTWNCKHIANAELQKVIAQISHREGYEMPVLCTPEVLMGD
jgi:hypothetical protein